MAGFVGKRHQLVHKTDAMTKLYTWEKVALAVVALASFVAGFQSGGIIDGVMALAINALIVFGLFVLGNRVFRRKEHGG